MEVRKKGDVFGNTPFYIISSKISISSEGI